MISALLVFVGCNLMRPRDDKSITKEIQARLYQDPTLRKRDISIISQQGVVVLNGQVSSPDEKVAAERLTSSVSGVRHVVNQLVVVQSSPVSPAPERPAPTPK